MSEYVIYKLTNKVNGKIYIGQINNFKYRMVHHKDSPNYKNTKDYINKYTKRK